MAKMSYHFIRKDGSLKRNKIMPKEDSIAILSINVYMVNELITKSAVIVLNLYDIKRY